MSSEPTTNCPKCDAPVKTGKAFCSNCGTQLDVTEPDRREPAAPEFGATIVVPPPRQPGAASAPHIAPPVEAAPRVAAQPRPSERVPASANQHVPAPARRSFPWGKVALFAVIILLFCVIILLASWLLD